MTSKRTQRAVLLALFLAAALAWGCASGPPPTALELGEAALEQGDWRAAQVHFEQAVRENSDLGQAWLGQAQASLAGRDPERALRSLGRLAQVDPELFSGGARATYADALEAATRSRLQHGQAAAALVAARALVALEPNRSGLDRLLGSALLAEAERLRLLGEREPALALYREACGVVPQSLDAWVGAAELLIEARKGKETVKLLEAARKVHPTAGSIRSLSLQALKIR
jgi:tetratricopeptide (TPR) repeat protein